MYQYLTANCINYQFTGRRFRAFRSGRYIDLINCPSGTFESIHHAYRHWVSLSSSFHDPIETCASSVPFSVSKNLSLTYVPAGVF